jgi:hypothetical protein
MRDTGGREKPEVELERPSEIAVPTGQLHSPERSTSSTADRCVGQHVPLPVARCTVTDATQRASLAITSTSAWTPYVRQPFGTWPYKLCLPRP